MARRHLWSLLSGRARGPRRAVRDRLHAFLRRRSRGFLLRLLRESALALAVAGALLGGGTARAVDLADVAAGDGGFVIQRAGGEVSGAGDVNGDGVPDVVVRRRDDAYVVFGKADTASIDLTALDERQGFVIRGAAGAVSGAGDVDGDGLADVVVGLSDADPGGREDAGESYVVFGKADGGPVDLADVEAGQGGFVIRGQLAGDRAGVSVSGAGDVDGDGLADVIIGAPWADPGGRELAGSSYVVFGKRDSGAVELADVATGDGGFVMRGASGYVSYDFWGDVSGASVSGAGDVNGDGLADVIVGAPGAHFLGGESYVVFGKADGEPIELASVADGDGGFVIRGYDWFYYDYDCYCNYYHGEYVGSAVSAAGDVDGDGLADVAVGTDPPWWGDGTVYVVFGKADGAAVETSEIGENETAGFAVLSGSSVGEVVSGAGDVNGDGFDDVIVGEPLAAARAGVGHVVLGGGQGGFTVQGAERGRIVTEEVCYCSDTGQFVFCEGCDDVCVDFEDPTVHCRSRVSNHLVGGDLAGTSVSGVGDMDGDGLADFAVSAPGAGRTYVVFGASGLPDCNQNGVPDIFDLASGTSDDCDENGVPDDCEADCDGIPNACAIASGASDCDGNAIPDACDISSGTSTDCNLNDVPDSCEISAGESEDCNRNGLPDECEADCDGDGTPDECAISSGASGDCDGNGVPDACDIAGGASADCNGNDLPDECEADCDNDGVPDSCEADCDSNGRPDDCEPDCDADGVPDACEISSGASEDCNRNGLPDECEAAPALFGASLVFPGALEGVEPGASVSALVDFVVPAACYLERERVQLVLGLGASALRCLHDGPAPEEPGANGPVEVTFTAPAEPGEYTLHVLYEEETSCGEAMKLYSEERARTGEVLGQPRGLELGTLVVESGVVFLRGDCDGDGQLPGAVNDAIANFQHCFSGREVPCLAACDADADGNPCSGVTDGLRILRFVFQSGNPPPAPFPECGTSNRPEDEALGCESSGCRAE